MANNKSLPIASKTKAKSSKKALPIVTKNILACFYAATATDIVDGTSWYPVALKYCQAIANESGLSVAKVAAVVAAISPNNKWEKNIKDAENLCLTYVTEGKDAAEVIKVSTYGVNKAKAIAILEGDDTQENHLNILNGQKVKAFYLNIMGDPDVVTVDGHAYSVWVGKYIPTTQTPAIGVAMHKQISSSYVKAKTLINKQLGTSYTASEIQAITWIVHKKNIAVASATASAA
jgi:hypothetical protein